MHRLCLVLVFQMSKSISVQLITAVAVAILRDIILPRQQIHARHQDSFLVQRRFSVQTVNLVERGNSVTVPSALTPTPSKVFFLQETCILLMPTAFLRSLSWRFFLAKVLYNSCLSLRRTAMFTHLFRARVSYPVLWGIQNRSQPEHGTEHRAVIIHLWQSLQFRTMSSDLNSFSELAAQNPSRADSALLILKQIYLSLINLRDRWGWFCPSPTTDELCKHRTRVKIPQPM